MLRKKITLVASLFLAGLLCTAAQADNTFTTPEGVLSIALPGDNWQEVADDSHWLTFSDGNDIITIEHLSNGENLPEVQLANDNFMDIYQVFFSTKNEVFVITGKIADANSIQPVRDAISSIDVLKYDTKKAINKTEPAAASANLEISPIGKAMVCVADTLNVYNGCSVAHSIIGTLSKGNGVYVIGSVLVNGIPNGWYQIDYLGLMTGYVSAAFLGEVVEATPVPTQAPAEPYKTGSVIGLYFLWSPVSIYGYSDGSFRDDAGLFYTNQGNGVWTDSNGLYYYDYYPNFPLRSDGSQSDATGDTMELYSHDGFTQNIYLYDNGSWYDNNFNEYILSSENEHMWINTNDNSSWIDYGDVGPLFSDDAEEAEEAEEE